MSLQVLAESYCTELKSSLTSKASGDWREIPASLYVHKFNMFLISVSIYLSMQTHIYTHLERKRIYRESENTYKIECVSVITPESFQHLPFK